MTDGWGISCKIALWWMSLGLTDDKSTLVQVMAWCRQATSHYLSQCWPRSMLPYDVTRPQRVKSHLCNSFEDGTTIDFIYRCPVFKWVSEAWLTWQVTLIFYCKWYLSRQLNCWSLRCNWSIACQCCSNYIFILNLIPGLNRLHKDNCQMGRQKYLSLGIRCGLY